MRTFEVPGGPGHGSAYSNRKKVLRIPQAGRVLTAQYIRHARFLNEGIVRSAHGPPVIHQLFETDPVDRVRGAIVPIDLSHTHQNRRRHMGRCPGHHREPTVSVTELYRHRCDLVRTVQPAAEPLRVTNVRVPPPIVARFRHSLECCRLLCCHLTGSTQQVLGQFDGTNDVLRISIGPD